MIEKLINFGIAYVIAGSVVGLVIFIKGERKTHYPWVVGYKRPSKSVFY